MNPPPASVGGYRAFGCCWHSTDNDVGYIATIGPDTGQTTDPNTITMIARFSLATPDSFTHTAYLVDHNAPYTAPITGPQIPFDGFQDGAVRGCTSRGREPLQDLRVPGRQPDVPPRACHGVRHRGAPIGA